MVRNFSFFFLLFIPIISFASDVIILPITYSYKIINDDNKIDYCIQLVADKYGLNPEIFYLIAQIESRMNPHALNKNKNGSYDIGLMQINTQTARYYGYKPDDLWDICTNVEVAALKLTDCYRRYGNTFKTV